MGLIPYTGCITRELDRRGVVVGRLVPALFDVIEAGTHVIQERCGSMMAHRVCNSSWIDEMSLIRPPQHF